MAGSRGVALRTALVLLLAGGFTAVVAKPGAGASVPPTAVLTAVSTKDDINKIQHVVVIMQENRSFDSYFGTYPGAAGIPMKNGTPTVCVNEPATGRCMKPYIDHDDVNGDRVGFGRRAGRGFRIRSRCCRRCRCWRLGYRGRCVITGGQCEG